MCTFIIICKISGWRQKCKHLVIIAVNNVTLLCYTARKNKPETMMMTENNPAYGFVTTPHITTQKNSAYEIININT